MSLRNQLKYEESRNNTSLISQYFDSLTEKNIKKTKAVVVQTKQEFNKIIKDIIPHAPITIHYVSLPDGMSMNDENLKTRNYVQVNKSYCTYTDQALPKLDLKTNAIVDYDSRLLPNHWKIPENKDNKQRFQVITNNLLPISYKNAEILLKHNVKDVLKDVPLPHDSNSIEISKTVQEYADNLDEIYKHNYKCGKFRPNKKVVDPIIIINCQYDVWRHENGYDGYAPSLLHIAEVYLSEIADKDIQKINKTINNEVEDAKDGSTKAEIKFVNRVADITSVDDEGDLLVFEISKPSNKNDTSTTIEVQNTYKFINQDDINAIESNLTATEYVPKIDDTEYVDYNEYNDYTEYNDNIEYNDSTEIYNDTTSNDDSDIEDFNIQTNAFSNTNEIGINMSDSLQILDELLEESKNLKIDIENLTEKQDNTVTNNQLNEKEDDLIEESTSEYVNSANYLVTSTKLGLTTTYTKQPISLMQSTEIASITSMTEQEIMTNKNQNISLKSAETELILHDTDNAALNSIVDDRANTDSYAAISTNNNTSLEPEVTFNTVTENIEHIDYTIADDTDGSSPASSVYKWFHNIWNSFKSLFS